MERVRGKILLDGEKVIFDNVDIGIEIIEPLPSGVKAWYGAFTVEGLSGVEPGGPYRLILEDGRSGDMLINKLEMSSTRTTVFFQGKGPLR